RRAHDVGIVKEQEISLPFFVKLISNLWVIGLVLLLFDLWQGRRRQDGVVIRPRWVLALVAVLVAASLSFVFLSGPIRHRSSRDGSGSAFAVVRLLKPAQMDVLAYVPGDSNVVAAMQVAEALRDPL